MRVPASFHCLLQFVFHLWRKLLDFRGFILGWFFLFVFLFVFFFFKKMLPMLMIYNGWLKYIGKIFYVYTITIIYHRNPFYARLKSNFVSVVFPFLQKKKEGGIFFEDAGENTKNSWKLVTEKDLEKIE